MTIGEQPKEDGVSLHIFFSRHKTAEDFMPAVPLIDGTDGLGKADVYCPEHFGWTEGYRNRLEAVLDGRLSSSQADASEATGYLLNILHGSGKRIFIPDIPADHRLVAKHSLDRMRDNTTLAQLLYIDGDFDHAFTMYTTCSRADALDEEEREAFISNKFKELAGLGRELRKKIKAVCTLGFGHTDMKIELGKGFEVARIVDGSQSYKVELIRRLIDKKECSDELFASALFEDVLINVLEELTNEGVKVYAVSRHLMKNLTPENIRWLSEGVLKKVKKGFSVNNITRNPACVEALKRGLMDLGIKVPSSRDEFDALFETL